MVFDEIIHSDQGSTKVYAEEDEHNITLVKLESCSEKKQLIDSAKQPIEILQQEELSKEWRIPRDLSVENIIGCKWVFRNKLDESGVITRNKARLVAKGYNQEECIDYGETFAPIARLEVVRLLLAFACMSGFKLFKWMLRVLSSMESSVKKSMLNNHRALKIINIPTMYTS